MLLGFLATVSAAHHLMPGDRVQIVCAENPRYSVIRTIQEDGRVSLPEGITVGLASRTCPEAAGRISSAIGAVAEIVPEYAVGGAISISGAVSRSMEVRFKDGTSLANLIKIAGPTDSADTDHIAVDRSDGTFVVVAASKGFQVRDGDRVFVPIGSSTPDVTVVGGVVTPSAIRFHKGMTLGEAILGVGGLAPRGDGTKVVVTRRGEPVPRSLPDDADFLLEPGETVTVTVKADRRFVVVQGDVRHPGLIELSSGMTVTQAIEGAGGALHDRDEFVALGSVVAKVPKKVWLNLAFMRGSRIPDPVLHPDDVVEVRQGAGKE